MRPAKRGLALTRQGKIRWRVAAALAMAWAGTLVQFVALPFTSPHLFTVAIGVTSGLGLAADCAVTWLVWRTGMLRRR